MSNKSYGAVDLAKLAAAVLVITIHIGPLMSISPASDYILTGIFARLGVPIFFMASGFFFFRQIEEGQWNWRAWRRFMARIGALYGIGILLYAPLNLYSGHFDKPWSGYSIVRELLWGGTFYHLWYLPAMMLGLTLVYALRTWIANRYVLTVAAVLYGIALLGDSYYGLSLELGPVSKVYDHLFQLFGQTRNGLLFAPIFIALGASAGRRDAAPRDSAWYGGMFLVSFALLIAEGTALHHDGMPIHNDMYIALIPADYALFRLLLLLGGKERRIIRSMSTSVYMLHPLVIALVHGGVKAAGLQSVVLGSSMVNFLSVTALSLLFALAIAILTLKRKRPMPNQQRTWVEINLNHLDHNTRVLQQSLPEGTAMMAVVKANAYGHGSVQVAKRLYSSGIRHFAVAEIGEGVELRKHGVKGEILVLGYTPTQQLGELVRWKLTQTVIHADDARRLQDFGSSFKVHVKIDTGMNRLGEPSDHPEEILSMYRHSRLHVTGTYSHLAEADNLDCDGAAFSKEQIRRFHQIVDVIRDESLDPGRLHLQSSYGILNFPELRMDMARPGIALYGLLSLESDTTRMNVELRPVLSLKASDSLSRAYDQSGRIRRLWQKLHGCTRYAGGHGYDRLRGRHSEGFVGTGRQRPDPRPARPDRRQNLHGSADR